MKRLALAFLVVGLFAPVAVAEEAVTVANVPGTFERYVVEPVRFVHRGAWGALTLAFKVGKAPIDAAFTLVGKAIGTDPNAPLWE